MSAPAAMCPDKKLDWFMTNPNWRDEHRSEVRELVEKRWLESYVGQGESTSTALLDENKKKEPTVRLFFSLCTMEVTTIYQHYLASLQVGYSSS